VQESDGCAGIDGVTIGRFSQNLESEISRLLADLTGGSYVPLPLLRFHVPKKDGSERALNVAAVRDRVAQRAVIDVIEPTLEAEFENCSYGFRRGRSVRLALEQIQFLRDSGYTWVVEADIDDFFDTVNHQIVFDKFASVFPESPFHKLIRLWVRARIYDGRRLWTAERGLPQGQPISPVLANLYLDKFDEELNKGGRKLVRYADDFVILCKSKPLAERALRLTRKLIHQLDLSLNDEDTGVTHFNKGFSYLGAKFFLGICVVPPRRRRKTIDAGVKMPERFFTSLPILHDKLHFNPTMGLELARALSANNLEETMLSQNIQGRDFLPPATVSLCTLYVHEHGATLRYENERVEVGSYGRELLSVPIRKIEQIILFGNSQITTTVMKQCLKRRIPIFIFSGPSRLLGSIEAYSGSIELQELQIDKRKDPIFRSDLARRIVAGKIENCRRFLQRREREGADVQLGKSIDGLARMLSSLADTVELDKILGFEGASAAHYFAGYARCIDTPFAFSTRSKRPPLDPINALLSFGYTMLFQNIYALVRARGLSPYFGFVHEIAPDHPALCSDLIEEFRSPIVDSLVAAVVNRRILRADDFVYEEYRVDDDSGEGDLPEFTGPQPDALDSVRRCILKDDARRRFIAEYERRMNTEITHRGAGLRTTWRGCIDLQIGHLIKVLRGESDHYRPFEFK